VAEDYVFKLARRALPAALYLGLAVVLGVFVLSPLLLAPQAIQAPLQALELVDPAWTITWTLGQAAASASLAVLLGLPVGVAGGFYGARTARAYRVLGLPVFMAPSVAVVLGFRELTALGLAPAWASEAPQGIILVHAYFNIPLAAVLVYSSVAGIPRETIEFLESIGLRGRRLLVKAVLPAALPGAASAWALAFLYAFTGLAAPLMVEGSAYRYYTLEAWIYTMYWSFPSYRGAAALLALLQAGILIAAALLLVRASLASRGELGESSRPGRARGLLEAYSIVLLALLYLPLAAVVAGSLIDPYTGETGLGAYRLLLEGAVGLPPGASFTGSLANSLAYAVLAAGGATLLSLPLVLGGGVWRRLAGVSPLIVSPVMVGVALSLTVYPVLVQALPRRLTVLLLVVIAHAAMALPLASRSMDAGLGRMPRELATHIVGLGLRGWRLAGVLARAAGPGLTASIVLSIAASLGEFGAVLVITDPETWSLGVLVYKLYSAGRAPHVAAAAATILLAMVVLAAWAAARRMREWF